MQDKNAEFIDFFQEVPDHRVDRRKLHQVEEILLVTFCGVIAGCEIWDDIELFGKTKQNDLRQYLPFKYGVPSYDTLRRFFRALDPSLQIALYHQLGRLNEPPVTRRFC